ncbi:MAG: transcriptional regulator, partial [Propionibacteriaceae bacterium]|nr:transcriptional regulator [Propionibacteriaceae bacterium]
GGQGMFAIALGGVWRDIEGTLATLPTQRVEDDMDELAKRRAAKIAPVAV